MKKLYAIAFIMVYLLSTIFCYFPRVAYSAASTQLSTANNRYKIVLESASAIVGQIDAILEGGENANIRMAGSLQISDIAYLLVSRLKIINLGKDKMVFHLKDVTIKDVFKKGDSFTPFAYATPDDKLPISTKRNPVFTVPPGSESTLIFYMPANANNPTVSLHFLDLKPLKIARPTLPKRDHITAPKDK